MIKVSRVNKRYSKVLIKAFINTCFHSVVVHDEVFQRPSIISISGNDRKWLDFCFSHDNTTNSSSTVLSPVFCRFMNLKTLICRSLMTPYGVTEFIDISLGNRLRMIGANITRANEDLLSIRLWGINFSEICIKLHGLCQEKKHIWNFHLQTESHFVSSLYALFNQSVTFYRESIWKLWFCRKLVPPLQWLHRL